MTIADNGHGFETARRQNPRQGLGLRNMQERVEQLDGSLNIQSGNSGTRISVSVPLTHLLPPESSSTSAPKKPMTEVPE
jgi:two-component system NarL family sensor kinase